MSTQTVTDRWTAEPGDSVLEQRVSIPEGVAFRYRGVLTASQPAQDYGVPRPQVPLVEIREQRGGQEVLLVGLSFRPTNRRFVLDQRGVEEALRDPVPREQRPQFECDWTFPAVGRQREIIVRFGIERTLHNAYVPPLGWTAEDHVVVLDDGVNEGPAGGPPPAEPTPVGLYEIKVSGTTATVEIDLQKLAAGLFGDEPVDQVIDGEALAGYVQRWLDGKGSEEG